MAQNLWQLRQRRGMSVKQLAAKSGVPASSLEAYEQGQETIRMADLSRLARVLYVDEFEIKLQSDPRPDPPQPKPAKTEQAPPEEAKKPSPAQKEKQKPKKKQPQQEAAPARPSQLSHLLTLAEKAGEDETAVSDKIGKTVAELSKDEASYWLKQYQEKVSALKKAEEERRPPDTRRKRAHLPEGVDEFELNYLTARKEAGDWLAFTLFDGTVLEGQVVGFSPYNITIQQADGTETTLQKLALAYYSVTDKGRAEEGQEDEPG